MTRNRRTWLPKAIDCYQKQTYPRELRELLIIADGEDVRDLLRRDPDDSIRLLHIESGIAIGAKRNLGGENAKGEVIVHWDDDDWSHPDRLVHQIRSLQTSAKSVVGFNSMEFRDCGSGKRWLYRGASVYALGTSLVYSRAWWDAHRFMGINVGEDNQFVGQALTARQIFTEPAGDLMYATIHPSNTSPRNLSGSNWTEIKV